ncbi:ribose 5-phosphate isomerase B [Mesoterricola silvestris]|uniref:Ribose 5-phosphate isomerase B n=1 Tax=Mesoterricola silvestris TaxID=2927979 RepID=A0AA48GVU5_9BACT|nr:ribose 5-phosphate isomerase B [Mesoterricola silvestris]BDU72766.1 ribose 5-phosphate isomerase B [Mesoterricola silvestris]
MDPQRVEQLVSEVVREVLSRRGAQRRVALGSDHGGFDLKKRLAGLLEAKGFGVLDVGCPDKTACDYPDFAKAVARAVLGGACEMGIMIDGAGIGSSMACNRFPGIRAALCYDLKTILNSRQHNNANVLTLGAGANPPEVVEQMVLTWLATPYEGGRHQKRVEKIES